MDVFDQAFEVADLLLWNGFPALRATMIAFLAAFLRGPWVKTECPLAVSDRRHDGWNKSPERDQRCGVLGPALRLRTARESQSTILAIMLKNSRRRRRYVCAPSVG